MSREFDAFEDFDEADLRDPALSSLLAQLGQSNDVASAPYGSVLTRVHRVRQRRMIATSAAAVVALVSGAFIATNRSSGDSPANPGVAVPLSPGDSVAVQTSVLEDGSVITIPVYPSDTEPLTGDPAAPTTIAPNDPVPTNKNGSPQTTATAQPGQSNPTQTTPGQSTPTQTTPGKSPTGNGSGAVSADPTTTSPNISAPKTTVATTVPKTTEAPAPPSTPAPTSAPKTTVAATVPSTPAPTPPSTPAPTTPAPRQSEKVCGGGTVTYTLTTNGISLVSAMPTTGFEVRSSSSSRKELKVNFRGISNNKAKSAVSISQNDNGTVVAKCEDENIGSSGSDSSSSESSSTDSNNSSTDD